MKQSHITAEYLREQGLSPTFPARFFAKVQFTDCCWLWTGYRMPNGYGQIGKRSYGGIILTHRASWILHFGLIPHGLNVCHDCPSGDNPSCVNPAHLWLGTTNENGLDASSKGTVLGKPHYGEEHGRHKVTEEGARFIREHYQKIRTAELARRFGVTIGAVWFIGTGRTWKHIKTGIRTN